MSKVIDHECTSCHYVESGYVIPKRKANLPPSGSSVHWCYFCNSFTLAPQEELITRVRNLEDRLKKAGL